MTWTPGDVTVAEKRGGIVSIVSTREYRSQMPNVIIGIDKWMRNNRQTVEDMLAAIMEGGDAVKRDPQALHRAAEISQEVYHEEGANADYWEKYYNGTRERDKQGLMVELGGSYVNNLADNMLLFGLVEGAQNAFAATYKVFGDIVVQQYPELVPKYAPVDSILDTSYLRALMRRSNVAAVTPTKPSEEEKASLSRPIKNVVSRKSWNITFQSGKATFTPAAKSTLEKLLRDLLVASGVNVELHGHTDSVGNPASNMALSEARAFAVKKWLEGRAPVNFPKGRIRVFAHGQTNPVASNTSEAGKAQNRRVEIVMGVS